MKNHFSLAILSLLLLLGCASPNSRGDSEGPPALDQVKEALRVRVACWLGWTEQITQDRFIGSDRGRDDGWRYFDVMISLQGLPPETTARELLEWVAKQKHQTFRVSFLGHLDVLRWSEKDGKYLRVSKQSKFTSKPILPELQQGDFLVFHGTVD